MGRPEPIDRESAAGEDARRGGLLISDDEGARIARFLDGDAATVAEVRDWLKRAATAYRRRLQAEWDDLIQDLYLELRRNLVAGRFRGESSLQTYIWRLVGHTCLDHIRSLRRRPEMAMEIPEVENPEPSPLRSALAVESRGTLLEVLARTPAECRRLWGMILEGLSYDQMAEQLGVRAGTLRVKVLRCRQRAVAARRQIESEIGRG